MGFVTVGKPFPIAGFIAVIIRKPLCGFGFTLALLGKLIAFVTLLDGDIQPTSGTEICRKGNPQKDKRDGECDLHLIFLQIKKTACVGGCLGSWVIYLSSGWNTLR